MAQYSVQYRGVRVRRSPQGASQAGLCSEGSTQPVGLAPAVLLDLLCGGCFPPDDGCGLGHALWLVSDMTLLQRSCKKKAYGVESSCSCTRSSRMEARGVVVWRRRERRRLLPHGRRGAPAPLVRIALSRPLYVLRCFTTLAGGCPSLKGVC